MKYFVPIELKGFKDLLVCEDNEQPSQGKVVRTFFDVPITIYCEVTPGNTEEGKKIESNKETKK